MLNLANLESIIQSKVDALGPTATEKDLLLLSKAIEAAVGNITVSKICERGAIALVDIEAARLASIADVGAAGTAEIELVNAAGAEKVAAIGALDAVPKSGGTMTGPLTGTDITANTIASGSVTADDVDAEHLVAGDASFTTANATTVNANQVNSATLTADAASPTLVLRESDGPADGKVWDVNVENQTLAFRIWNEALSAYTSFLKFIRSGVASIYILFTTAVRASIIPLTDSATITANFQLGNIFSVTLGGNRTLANPANIDANHQGGAIIIRQDGSGNRTLSFGNAWKFPGGVVPGLSPGAGKVDRLQYTVVSPTEIHAVLLKDIR